jgi:hypothetical protein
MLDSDKGFFLVGGYPTGGYHFIVDVQETYVTVACFKEVFETSAGVFQNPSKRMPVEWSTVSEKLTSPITDMNKSGLPDNWGKGELIDNYPTAGDHRVEYLGRTMFTPGGMIGQDELSDYSLLDITISGGKNVQSWSNRFSSSRQDKIDTSFRHRAKTSSPTIMAIFWPLKVANLSETRIEILGSLSNVTLINGTVPTGTIDGPAVIPNDGRWYEQFYFHVKTEADLTVPAGGTINVPLQLHWNKPDAPKCEASIKLKVEEVSGYAPHKRVTTDNHGFATVRVSALGLAAGETVQAKFNLDHFSSLGVINVRVV